MERQPPIDAGVDAIRNQLGEVGEKGNEREKDPIIVPLDPADRKGELEGYRSRLSSSNPVIMMRSFGDLSPQEKHESSAMITRAEKGFNKEMLEVDKLEEDEPFIKHIEWGNIVDWEVEAGDVIVNQDRGTVRLVLTKEKDGLKVLRVGKDGDVRVDAMPFYDEKGKPTIPVVKRSGETIKAGVEIFKFSPEKTKLVSAPESEEVSEEPGVEFPEVRVIEEKFEDRLKESERIWENKVSDEEKRKGIGEEVERGLEEAIVMEGSFSEVELKLMKKVIAKTGMMDSQARRLAESYLSNGLMAEELKLHEEMDASNSVKWWKGGVFQRMIDRPYNAVREWWLDSKIKKEVFEDNGEEWSTREQIRNMKGLRGTIADSFRWEAEQEETEAREAKVLLEMADWLDEKNVREEERGRFYPRHDAKKFSDQRAEEAKQAYRTVFAVQAEGGRVKQWWGEEMSKLAESGASLTKLEVKLVQRAIDEQREATKGDEDLMKMIPVLREQFIKGVPEAAAVEKVSWRERWAADGIKGLWMNRREVRKKLREKRVGLAGLLRGVAREGEFKASVREREINFKDRVMFLVMADILDEATVKEMRWENQ
jgi:hypothetical protein